MAGIGSAAVILKLPIGETPISVRPEIRADMQDVYNSLHILNAYLDALRNEFEGNDTNDPAQNLPFRKKFKARARQNIAAGAIVSITPTGMVNGVQASTTNTPSNTTYFGYADPGTRREWGMRTHTYFVALEAAAEGAQVEVGVGMGVIKVVGAKNGQIVWASDSRWINYARGQINDNAGQTAFVNREFANDGAIYLSNPSRTETYLAASADWEGLPRSGYPYRDGDWKFCSQRFLFPVGIAIMDDFVLIRDFVRDPTYDSN